MQNVLTSNRIKWLIVLGSLLLTYSPAFAEKIESRDDLAARILNEIDDMWRGKSAHVIISMHIKTAHYTRLMRIEEWSKGRKLSLVRIVFPLKEKGTTTLKSGNNVYTYLPKTDRTIRITSGMMMSSWMGSHFTNDDLVKESRLADDYNIGISFEGKRDGQDLMEFTLIPKPDAAVVWGKIVITIRKEDYIPLIALYYDEDMQIVRSMTYRKVKDLGGRTIPSVMRLTPENKPEEFTEVVLEEIEFDVDLADSMFSLAQLRRK